MILARLGWSKAKGVLLPAANYILNHSYAGTHVFCPWVLSSSCWMFLAWVSSTTFFLPLQENLPLFHHNTNRNHYSGYSYIKENEYEQPGFDSHVDMDLRWVQLGPLDFSFSIFKVRLVEYSNSLQIVWGLNEITWSLEEFGKGVVWNPANGLVIVIVLNIINGNFRIILNRHSLSPGNMYPFHRVIKSSSKTWKNRFIICNREYYILNLLNKCWRR